MYGRRFVTDGTARSLLRDANVPTVELHSIDTTWTHARFRASQRKDTIVPLGRAWSVGAFLWKFNDGGNYGGSEIEEVCETLLLDRATRPDYCEGGLSGFWGGDFLAPVFHEAGDDGVAA